MNVLFVATKSPWPPIDGGRLLMRDTLAELARQGHHVTVVAPAIGSVTPAPGIDARLVAARPRSRLAAALAALAGGGALSIARHSLPAVRTAVARVLGEGGFDVVHAEQLHALAQATPAHDHGVPVVLRAQNVESDLWAASVAVLGPARRRLARREARYLAASEGRAVARAATTVALTRQDAERLDHLAGGRGRVRVVPAPFPASLPQADAPLAGNPAIVVLGSEGWLPNRDAVLSFVAGTWPALRRALPEARLHLFGKLELEGAGLVPHPPPDDSRVAFAPGSILAVPLRIASGVRMKILEAWARGVPVVASPAAVRGLDAEHEREVLVADDVAGTVEAVRRLHGEPRRVAALAAAGRARLVERHDPATVTAELVAVYEEARRR